MKKLATAVVLACFVAISCLFPQVGLGQTQPEVVVVPDDFGSIQQAIDTVKDGGKVFVHKGMYYENLTITKSVFLIGEDSKTTIIDSQGNATVVLVRADNVTVTGFTVKFSDAETPSHYMGPDKLHGIHLLYADYCNVSGNNLTFNAHGIWLYNSHFNSITENNCTDNWTGIRMEGSSNNRISDNYLKSNRYGARFYGSQNNVLEGNCLLDNSNDFIVSEDSFVNNIDESNTVNEKPIVYWINQQQRTVEGDVAFVFLLNCSEILVQNLNLVNGYYGVVCINCTNCTIQKCNITNQQYAIWLFNSAKITITKNSLAKNSDSGAVQLFLSDNNTVCKNVFTANFYGVKLLNSSHNNILENTMINQTSEAIAFFDACKHNSITANNISYNGGGIWFQFPTCNTEECYSNYNMINKNIINANKAWGILIQPTTKNTFTENNITNNKQGVVLNTKDNSNIFYLNNFSNNTVNTYTKSTAVWSQGSKGNFWSDYQGKDNNGDGIGDTPYIIDENNSDNTPLMKPTVIPEFSLWIVLPLMFTATIIALTAKNKLSKSTKPQTC